MAGSVGDNKSFTEPTKTILGKYIKKPPLTDSNLSRPPFKYLQHLITAVIKQTGLLAGLYTDDELASADKDKSTKAQFLQKAIDCVQHVHSKRLAVKPSKIVAGLEPEQTNLFLQAIGTALDANLDSGEAVKRVLNAEKPDYSSDFTISNPSEPNDGLTVVVNGNESNSAGNSAGSNKENSNHDTKAVANGDLRGDHRRRESKDVRSNSTSKRRESTSKKGESSSSSKDAAAKRSSSKDRGAAKDDKSKSSSSNRRDPSKERKSKDANEKGATSSSTKPRSTKESESKSKDSRSRDPSRKRAEPDKEKSSTSKRSSSKDTKERTSSNAKGRSEEKPKPSSKKSSSSTHKTPANETDSLSPTSHGATHNNNNTNNNNNNNAALTNGNLSSPSPRNSSKPSSPDRPAGVSHSAGPARPSGESELSAADDESNRKAYSAVPRPGSAMRRPGTAMGRPGTAMGGGRPTTARPAPPRVRKVVAEPAAPDAGGATETAGRENSAGNKTLQNTIITDSRPSGSGGSNKSNPKAGADDDTDQFIIQESLIDDTGDNDILGGGGGLESVLEDGQEQGVDASTIDADDHGGLVRKILETKKDLESNIDHQTATNNNNDQQSKDGGLSVTVFDEKERDRARKEAVKLQASIQTLTRTSHPFGRLMDFMQEDIDGMMRELEQWRTEVRQSWGLLRERSGGSEAELEALRNKLTDFDAIIRDERDAIRTIRANILENDDKTRQLMAGNASSK